MKPHLDPADSQELRGIGKPQVDLRELAFNSPFRQQVSSLVKATPNPENLIQSPLLEAAASSLEYWLIYKISQLGMVEGF